MAFLWLNTLGECKWCHQDTMSLYLSILFPSALCHFLYFHASKMTINFFWYQGSNPVEKSTCFLSTVATKFSRSYIFRSDEILDFPGLSPMLLHGVRCPVNYIQSSWTEDEKESDSHGTITRRRGNGYGGGDGVWRAWRGEGSKHLQLSHSKITILVTHHTVSPILFNFPVPLSFDICK